MQHNELRCYICGKRIAGTYYHDWAGHAVCSSHPIKYCVSCGQICNHTAISVGTDMKVCPHCKKYRIEKWDSGRIIGFLKDFYASTPIGLIKGWHLMMISPDALYLKTKDKSTRGQAESIGSDYTIYIYRDLSRVAFARTLAHEMLHIYQYQHGFHPPKAKCEGFCNLGSYLVMKSISNREALASIRNMEADPDTIYGDGFRYMKSIYYKAGWNGVIAEIQRKDP